LLYLSSHSILNGRDIGETGFAQSDLYWKLQQKLMRF